MSKIKFPSAKLSINIVGPKGNAYYILGATKKRLQNAGATKEEIQQYVDDAKSSDYNHLLWVTHKWIDFEEYHICEEGE